MWVYDFSMEIADPSSLQELAVERLKSLGAKLLEFVVDNALLVKNEQQTTPKFNNVINQVDKYEKPNPVNDL